jgi:hypothetical protein
LNQHAAIPDFAAAVGGTNGPVANNGDPVATNQILHHLLEQQILVQQQSQPPQQLLGNLMQAINKSQNPSDNGALVQMAMLAMQMNQQNAQNTPQTQLPLGNIVQQLLIAQSMNANGGFPAAPIPQLPYLNDSMFSVGSIRRVMEEEPQLFWSRMREVGVLDELLNSITVAVERIRALYSKRDSSSEEEEFGKQLEINLIFPFSAARRLSGMANLLDLGAVFGEKIRGRFVQSALESSLANKELQSRGFFKSSKYNDLFSGRRSSTQARRTEAEDASCCQTQFPGPRAGTNIVENRAGDEENAPRLNRRVYILHCRPSIHLSFSLPFKYLKLFCIGANSFIRLNVVLKRVPLLCTPRNTSPLS